MSTPQGTNTTGREFFKLSPELRNLIYEYVLADVQDNICIKLECGNDQAHKSRITKSRSVSRDDNASQLSMLLACKQINSEASGIAYSKMSISMSSISALAEGRGGHKAEGLAQIIPRVKSVFENFTETFDPANSSLIKTLVLRDSGDLDCMTDLEAFLSRFYSSLRVSSPTGSCTVRCNSFFRHRVLLHTTFHHIQRVIIQEDESIERTMYAYSKLTDGASWLSVSLYPSQVDSVLHILPSVQQIVVCRNSSEQVSEVVGGKIFAVESGMPLGGFADWLDNL
jgi:hypothetical protein